MQGEHGVEVSVHGGETFSHCAQFEHAQFELELNWQIVANECPRYETAQCQAVSNAANVFGVWLCARNLRRTSRLLVVLRVSSVVANQQ